MNEMKLVCTEYRVSGNTVVFLSVCPSTKSFVTQKVAVGQPTANLCGLRICAFLKSKKI